MNRQGVSARARIWGLRLRRLGMQHDAPIFATGATGTVASLIIPSLKSEGAELSALVHNPDKAQDLKNIGVEVFVGEFDKPETLAPALNPVVLLGLLNLRYKDAFAFRRSSGTTAINLDQQLVKRASSGGHVHLKIYHCFPFSPLRRRRAGGGLSPRLSDQNRAPPAACRNDRGPAPLRPHR